MKNGYSAYKSANIDTADQGKLIIICYDVAIKHCKLSIDLFKDYKDIELKSTYLYKAQDAIMELMGSLNMEIGEISENLYKLYDYIIRKISDGIIKNDKSAIDEVLGYLTSLREAWIVADQQVKKDNSQNRSAEATKNIAITA